MQKLSASGVRIVTTFTLFVRCHSVFYDSKSTAKHSGWNESMLVAVGSGIWIFCRNPNIVPQGWNPFNIVGQNALEWKRDSTKK